MRPPPVTSWSTSARTPPGIASAGRLESGSSTKGCEWVDCGEIGALSNVCFGITPGSVVLEMGETLQLGVREKAILKITETDLLPGFNRHV